MVLKDAVKMREEKRDYRVWGRSYKQGRGPGASSCLTKPFINLKIKGGGVKPRKVYLDNQIFRLCLVRFHRRWIFWAFVLL